MAEPAEPTEIRIARDGDVEVLTIDRPDARNALTFTTYAELQEAVETTTARCLVVTGADPAFCSGDDVKQVMTAVADAASTRDGAREPRLTPAAGALLRTDVPVIAAVNGAAVGWGMELALMADIRVLSERARFGELFVKRGLCCDVAGLGRLSSWSGGRRPPSCCSPDGSSTPPRRGTSGSPAGWCPTRSCSRPPSASPTRSPPTRPWPCRRSRPGCAAPSTPTGTTSAAG